MIAVRLLAEAGVNLNMRDLNGWTPLHHAIANRQGEVADMLIEKGADKEIKNDDGLTPFDILSMSKHSSKDSH